MVFSQGGRCPGRAAERDHGLTLAFRPTPEREELTRLRKENRILAEERDILKTVTAFFAKQSR